MESKVAEAMSKKETLKARALTAETTKQLSESITSMVRLPTVHEESSSRHAEKHTSKTCCIPADPSVSAFHHVHLLLQTVRLLKSYVAAQYLLDDLLLGLAYLCFVLLLKLNVLLAF